MIENELKLMLSLNHSSAAGRVSSEKGNFDELTTIKLNLGIGNNRITRKKGNPKNTQKAEI